MIRRLPLLLILVLCLAAPAGAQEPITSSRKAIILSQQLIDAGELEEALVYLERAVEQYPDNDNLQSLHGQALYESKQIDRAEVAFRRALKINPLNTVAKTYIEVIRETSIATTSTQAQVFESVAWDKAGDVVVLAMGFFLGTMLSGQVRNFNDRRFFKRCKKLFMVGLYEDFADMLEIQLGENSLRPLRHSLAFMLENKSMQECVDILSEHVNSEENLNTLLRMIKLSKGAPL